MAVNLADVYDITIPEGNVKQISAGGRIIWKRHRIPAAYEEVEWVQLPTGDTYRLDTGVPFTGTWDITAKLNGYNSSGNVPVFGGSSAAGRYLGTNQNGRWGGGSTTSGTYCSSSLATNKTTARVIFQSDGKKVSGSIGAQTFSRTGTNTDAIQHGYVPPQGINYKATLYSLVKWNEDETEKLYEGIPCRRKADGVYGMYDTVSGTFCGYSQWAGGNPV